MRIAMRLKFHILFFLFFTIIIDNLPCQDQDVSLSLRIEFVDTPPQIKKLFWLFGPKNLDVKVSIKNNSNQIVAIEDIFYGATLHFMVTDKSNSLTKQRGESHYQPFIDKYHYKVINPGQIYSDVINLFAENEYYFDDDSSYYIRAVFTSREPDSSMQPDAKIFIGRLDSNVLEFAPR